MENANEKKGIAERLKEILKVKKSSGCCNFELEEIPEEEQESEKKPQKD